MMRKVLRWHTYEPVIARNIQLRGGNGLSKKPVHCFTCAQDISIIQILFRTDQGVDTERWKRAANQFEEFIAFKWPWKTMSGPVNCESDDMKRIGGCLDSTGARIDH